MTRREACRQASQAILAFASSAHSRPHRPGMNQKSVQDSGVLGHFSKSDIRYWQRAVFRQSYTRSGKTLLTKGWVMKIAHEGRRETFPLGTPNKDAAAARARDIYLSLAGAGWEATLARYKKPRELTPYKEISRPCTVANSLMRCSGRPAISRPLRVTQKNSGRS